MSSTYQLRGIEWNRATVAKAFGLSVAVFAVLGLILGLQNYVTAADRKDYRGFIAIVSFPFILFQVHAWLSPAVCFVTTRFPLIGARVLRNISIHLASLVV